MKFKICNLSSVFGGQERYVESLIKSLKVRGFEVCIVGGPDRLLALNTNSYNQISEKEKNKILLLNGNAALYRSVRNLFLGDNDFIIYVQHSDINDGQQAKWKSWIRKVLIYFLLKNVDLVVRVCNKALPDIYANNKVITIYNGVELPKKSKIYSSPSPLRLVMIGAVNVNKNQKMAIEALQLVEEVELHIVGSGDDVKQLSILAKNLKVDDRVIWHGFKDDLEEIYLHSDILLMLSNYEAFPYAVLEAMSYGLTVIATKVGGVPEILKNNKNGILLESYQTVELANVLCQLQKSLVTLKQLGMCARETIEKGFTVDIMTENLLSEIKGAKKSKL